MSHSSPHSPLWRLAPLLLVLALAGLLAGGLVLLFDLRFEGGDNYPPYSSLRADPLGARVLYDGLRALPSLEVGRNLRPLGELREGAGTTMFYLGLDPNGLRDFRWEEARQLEAFLVAGGRLVLTLAPRAARLDRPLFEPRGETTQTLASRRASLARNEAGRHERPRKKRNEAERDDPQPIALTSRFDLDLDFRPLEREPNRNAYTPAEARRQAGADLPGLLRWRSGVFVRRLGEPWHGIYRRGADPVLVERPYGRGSLVLATDSFFASNEALRDERQSALLAWLVGPSRRVIFDETHLGVYENQGVMMLAFKYRLHGVLAVLLLLAALYIWQSATRLVPPSPESAGEALGGESGRDAWAGLVDLLQRNVGRDKILRVCLAEWARGRANTPGAKEMENKMEAIVTEQEGRPQTWHNVLHAYRAMAEVARKRGRK